VRFPRESGRFSGESQGHTSLFYRQFFRTTPCFGSTTIGLQPSTIAYSKPGPDHGQRLRRRRRGRKAFGAIWPPGIMGTRGLAAAGGARAAPPTTSTNSPPTAPPRLKPGRTVSCFPWRGTRPPANSADIGRRLSVVFRCALAGTVPERRAVSRRQGSRGNEQPMPGGATRVSTLTRLLLSAVVSDVPDIPEVAGERSGAAVPRRHARHALVAVEVQDAFEYDTGAAET